MLEHLGYPVTRLIRVAYGPFQLGHLARGAIEEVPRKVLQEQLGGAFAAAEARKREPAAHNRRELYCAWLICGRPLGLNTRSSCDR